MDQNGSGMTGVLNVLLVEDNADDVFLLRQAFKKAGMTSNLQTAADGLEARAYLKGEGAYGDRTLHPVPNLLLLDLNMPRMNGFELLHWLREDPEWNHLTVCVLTASSREDDIRHAFDLRANSYVVKPSRLDELTAFVTALHQWHRFAVLPTRSEYQTPAWQN